MTRTRTAAPPASGPIPHQGRRVGAERPDLLSLSKAALIDELSAYQQQLSAMVEIEQAKGALMLVYGLTEDAALALLQWYARHRNVELRDLCLALTTNPEPVPMGEESSDHLNNLLESIAVALHRDPALIGGPTIPRDHDVRGALHQEPGNLPAAWSVAGSSGGADDDLSQDLLRAVSVAAQGITLVVHSPDLPVVYANDAFLQMTGYTREDVLGRHCRFLQGPETNRSEIAAIRWRLATGRDARAILRNYRRDGTSFWNELSISTVRHPATAEITHYIALHADVTERVEQELEREDEQPDRPALPLTAQRTSPMKAQRSGR